MGDEPTSKKSRRIPLNPPTLKKSTDTKEDEAPEKWKQDLLEWAGNKYLRNV
jgi:hypothetical protein